MLRILSAPLANSVSSMARMHTPQRPMALAAAALASPAQAASSAASSSLFYTPCRTVVVDRATRRVGRQRRFRRALLRVQASRTAGAENESRRMAAQRPPLAGMDASAANLHQFVSFLARQHATRKAEMEADAALPESLRAARKVAAPGWNLGYEHVVELMPANKSFRACEELVGYLSDPTTELGLKGLDESQFNHVLAYVIRCMQRSMDVLAPRMRAALDGDFQHMRADDQYEMAGAYAVLYLIAQLRGDQAKMDTLLAKAQEKHILVPDNTLLGKALAQIHKQKSMPPHQQQNAQA